MEWLWAAGGFIAGWVGCVVFDEAKRRLQGRREYKNWKANQEAVRKWSGGR